MIAEALRALGPTLSTNLAQHLMLTQGLTAAAARQRVARASNPVKKLAHLPFARGVRFVYLEKDYRSVQYWERLYEAIIDSKTAYSRALIAIRARGIVPINHFLAACAAPVAQKKHLSASTVLERMMAAGVFETQEFDGLGLCVLTQQLAEQLRRWPDPTPAGVRARLISERILLDSVKEWVRRLGIASYDKVRLRDRGSEIPRVGTYAWDLTAPSYLTPLTMWGKGQELKPGMVACDVLLTEFLSLAEAEAFLYKVSALLALKKISKTLFIFIAEHFHPDAFGALKAAGIMVATPETLFGKDVAAGFRELTKVLTEAATRSVSPARFDELFNRLGKLEGAVGNMRGALFELLVAEVIRKERPGFVDLNKICRVDAGTRCEVDIWLIDTSHNGLFIECKGHAPGSLIDNAEIDEWLTKRIFIVRQYVRQFVQPHPVQLTFELWHTGQLSPEIELRIMRTREANRKQFELVVVGPEQIRARVRARNDHSLLKTFEQHFLPHNHRWGQGERGGDDAASVR